MSETMVILNVFEAGIGDFFWLEYTFEEERRHILIDSGSDGSFRDYRRVLTYIKEKEEVIEAIVFTHIDGDHIGGGIKALSLMKRDELPVIQRILMNSITAINVHINNIQLSVGQAMKLEQLFEILGLSEIIISPVLQGDSLRLPGDAWMKIISPDRQTLLQFEAKVERELKREIDSLQLRRKDEEPYIHNICDYVSNNDKEDDRPENMAGIAFIFELCDVRIAFLADANPTICLEGIRSFYGLQASFDLVKIAHHGSSKNITRKLAKILDAQNFLLSTNGHGGKPSKQMLCRLMELHDNINLLCNYAWWDQHYCGFYFTEKDKGEYIESGKLNLIQLKEQDLRICNDLIIRLRHKNREI